MSKHLPTHPPADPLLQGLKILNGAATTAQALQQLLDLTQALIGFTDACVIRNGTDRAQQTLSTTHAALGGWLTEHRLVPQVPAQGVGHATRIDTRENALAKVARCLIAVALDTQTALICAHADAQAFDEGQVAQAQRLAPLFTQALRIADNSGHQAPQQERTLDKLEETASRLSALLQNMRAGVLVEDTEGRVALANHAFCTCFGIDAPPEMLHGALCSDLAAGARDSLVDPEGFAAEVERTLALREPVHGARVELKDGRVLQRDYLPILESGRYMGTLWQYQDITERLNAQDNLRRSKELAEEANAAKTAFLATLSHEIRTPLNAVLGMTALTLGTRLDAEQRGFVRSIRTNSEALLHLLSDILDFTKIESGKMELERMPFDLGAQIEEVAELLAERAAAKQVALIVNVSETLPARVLGDPNRTRQVLMNLVGNAIKYTNRGHVIIRATCARLDHECIRARIEVQDTGIGMAPETIRHIFERFYRARSDSIEGTGLGLTISKELATLMKGSLQAESRLGEGSTLSFEVTWPVARAQDLRRLELQRALEHQEVILAMPEGPGADALAAALQTAGTMTRHAPSPELLQSCLQSSPQAVLILDEQWIERAGNLSERACVLLHTVGKKLYGIPPRIETVTKPVTRHVLWEALARVSGEQAPDEQATWDLITLSTDQPAQILLIEDNLDNQRVTSGLLERVGHVVHIAPDGRSGVRAAQSARFDLVLLDIDLPDISGLQVCTELRALPGLKELPVLAFTAHATEPMRKACEAAGMNGFLAKPVTARALLDTASHWLSRSAVRILVVDDMSDNRALLVHMLAQMHLTAAQASGGAQALDYLSKQPCDLLIMDLEMPGMDGIETLQAIRRTPGGRGLPVIMVTGHEQSELRRRGLPDGPFLYISKPVRRSDFQDAVRELLSDSPLGEQAAHTDDLLIDPEVQALLPGYATRSLEALDEARAELIEGRCERARTIGHQLKGTGASYGLAQVTDLGSRLEQQAANEQVEDALGLVGALRAQLRRWAQPET